MILNFPQIELNKNNALIFTAYLPSLYEHLPSLSEPLSIQEKTQAKKFINSYLRERYIISHGLLRYLLAFYAKSNPHTIEYSFNQFGKPFLKNNSSNLQFNMSHSKDYAAYILALDCQVGIDIEQKDKNIDIQGLLDLILTKEEAIIFNELNSAEKLDTFYEVWTKKEAILKALGQGLSHPMTLTQVMNVAANNGAHYLANNIKFYCSELTDLNGYSRAVAIAHETREFIQINLTS